jgi:hypothetical protein
MELCTTWELHSESNGRLSFGFLTSEDGTDRLSRNVVKYYHYSLRNNPQQRSYHLLRGGSLKSRMQYFAGKKRKFSSCKAKRGFKQTHAKAVARKAQI